MQLSERCAGAVACFAGSYNAIHGSDVCLPCPQGSYQTQPASVRCVKCVVGKTTASTGATSTVDCVSDVNVTQRQYQPNHYQRLSVRLSSLHVYSMSGLFCFCNRPPVHFSSKLVRQKWQDAVNEICSVGLRRTLYTSLSFALKETGRSLQHSTALPSSSSAIIVVAAIA